MYKFEPIDITDLSKALPLDPVDDTFENPLLPVVLVLDVSYSMYYGIKSNGHHEKIGTKNADDETFDVADFKAGDVRFIDALYESLQTFKNAALSYSKVNDSAEICVVWFDDTIKKARPFEPIDETTEFPLPDELKNNKRTNISDAIKQSLRLVNDRCSQIDKVPGLKRFEPWVILVTDCRAEYIDSSLVNQIKAQMADGALSFYTIGLSDKPDIKEYLSQFYSNEEEKNQFLHVCPDEATLKDCFNFVGNSLSSHAKGKVFFKKTLKGNR